MRPVLMGPAAAVPVTVAVGVVDVCNPPTSWEPTLLVLRTGAPTLAVTAGVGRGDNATGTSSALAARLVRAVSEMDETDVPARPCAASVPLMATPATLPPTVSASVAPRASAGAVTEGRPAATRADGVDLGRTGACPECSQRQIAMAGLSIAGGTVITVGAVPVERPGVGASCIRRSDAERAEPVSGCPARAGKAIQ
jgi:hypothetical protein